MTLPQTLLTLLADGEFHSGTSLGEMTARTRTAVWKAIQVLQKTGLEIYSVRGKGYRLAHAIELLDRDVILAALDDHTRQTVKKIELYHEIESTNAHLLALVKQGETAVQACIAESQRTGRGRRGRRWVSPLGGNLYLSLLWRFDAGAATLGGLSLAIAVAVMRTLRELGLKSAGLKWPNDIVVGGSKLAGILLEVAGEAVGPCSVVVGLGLNIRTPAVEMSSVEQPWTDLETVLGQTVPRNLLAAQLLCHLVSAISEFEQKGLAPFMVDWDEWDVLAGNEITLEMPSGNRHGVARGVDESGALLLASDGKLLRYHSGEVSARFAVSAANSGSIS